MLTVAGHGLYVGFDARVVEEEVEVEEVEEVTFSIGHSTLSLSLCSIEIGTFWDLKRYRSWNLLGDIFTARCSSFTQRWKRRKK